MANLDVYPEIPEIPSPSGASFRTLDDDPAPTPRRSGTLTPTQYVNERSRLLDRSEDDVFIGYNDERAVGRRKRPSTYAVVSTGSTSGAGTTGPNDDDDGGLCLSLVPSDGLFNALWLYL